MTFLLDSDRSSHGVRPLLGNRAACVFWSRICALVLSGREVCVVWFLTVVFANVALKLIVV